MIGDDALKLRPIRRYCVITFIALADLNFNGPCLDNLSTIVIALEITFLGLQFKFIRSTWQLEIKAPGLVLYTLY